MFRAEAGKGPAPTGAEPVPGFVYFTITIFLIAENSPALIL